MVKPEIGKGTLRSVKFGTSFYITLARATPSDAKQSEGRSFPTETLLAYDIELQEVVMDGSLSGNKENLATLGILDFVTYQQKKGERIPLPTFYIQDSNSPLRLLHGSCRALHGRGIDASMLADYIIEESVLDVKRRPSVMFLTGDQIYADDVAGALIGHLSALGAKVFGWEQHIKDMPLASNVPIFGRAYQVKRHTKFTSSNSDNHLLTIGEYVAMYLVAWNENNWPCRYPDTPYKHRAQYHEQLLELQVSRRSIRKFRRSLANISTYMIFDDHDVTDDWNLDGSWYRSVMEESESGAESSS